MKTQGQTFISILKVVANGCVKVISSFRTFGLCIDGMSMLFNYKKKSNIYCKATFTRTVFASFLLAEPLICLAYLV